MVALIETLLAQKLNQNNLSFVIFTLTICLLFHVFGGACLVFFQGGGSGGCSNSVDFYSMLVTDL